MPVITKRGNDHKPTKPEAVILEAWAEGMMAGALIVMGLITVANMRRKVVLHKFILIELLCALFNCFPMFIEAPVFGWYTSVSSIFLISSWTLHNVIGWIKSKPFLNTISSRIYIGSVILAQGYWIFQIVANFLYFNRDDPLYLRSRPLEPLFRDPWWIFTTLNLFWNVKHRYEFGFIELIKFSPRFAILLSSMSLSVIFLILEILAVTSVLHMSTLNPFWRLSFVFKCFTDTIILDDFKTALDKLSRFRHSRPELNNEQYGSVDLANNAPSPHPRSFSLARAQTDGSKTGVMHIESAHPVEPQATSSTPSLPITVYRTIG